jgi:hypothetical protein
MLPTSPFLVLYFFKSTRMKPRAILLAFLLSAADLEIQYPFEEILSIYGYWRDMNLESVEQRC